MWSPQTDIIPIGWKGHAQDTHRAIATDRAGHIWVASIPEAYGARRFRRMAAKWNPNGTFLPTLSAINV